MVSNARVYIIACGVLAKDLDAIAKKLPLTIGTHYLPAGLHERPNKLRRKLQTAIDRAAHTGEWDRIVVGYGVCGRGTVEIRAQAIPIVIPRVHDCIALFLGGDDHYQEQFKQYPGTYYISHGWYEAKNLSQAPDRRYAWMGDTKVHFDELVQRYGLRHAEATFSFLNSWRSNYQRAVFIDTGGDRHPAAEAYAERLAEKNHWRFEKIPGSTRLLLKLLNETQTTEEILVVPPGQITVFDAVHGRLSAHPILSTQSSTNGAPRTVVVPGQAPAAPLGKLHVGLGIDAGGTYTDAVIYDFRSQQVLAKNKALTTKWDFSIGIKEALAGLESRQIMETQLVSVSTTLATNAIVENDGQKVGLLLMPPPGFNGNRELIHTPQAVLSARLDITGKELTPPDDSQISCIARRMCDDLGIEAFAVSGYAGSINPEHELAVKRILQSETGRFVSCGHELSQLLNFKMRAQTAVHNARIVPRLTRLLEDVASVLEQMGIRAPVMVVRGDGSLMSQQLAMERPVETILSGPAASVAGARHLTGLKDAVVIDMGGTTTDIAALENGQVRLCESGSRVGPIRTHVRALAIQTQGLGGDSLLLYSAGEWQIGPRRVAPLAWLGFQNRDLDSAFDYLDANRRRLRGSSESAQMFTLNNRRPDAPSNDLEERVLGLLSRRPHSLLELSEATQVPHAGLLPLQRLESFFAIQRCGLTPTDLLHVTGRFVRWDAAASTRMVRLAAGLAGTTPEKLLVELLHRVVRQLTMEILHHQLAPATPHTTREPCSMCDRIFDNLLGGGGPKFAVRFELRQPIIGVGAPIGYFLPEVARLLGARDWVPEFHDVANAVGAITSWVSIKRQATIKPDPAGGFYIEGVPGHQRFQAIDVADRYVQSILTEEVRRLAAQAGTGQDTVQLNFKDVTAKTGWGEEIFIERQVVSEIQGIPDLP